VRNLEDRNESRTTEKKISRVPRPRIRWANDPIERGAGGGIGRADRGTYRIGSKGIGAEAAGDGGVDKGERRGVCRDGRRREGRPCVERLMMRGESHDSRPSMLTPRLRLTYPACVCICSSQAWFSFLPWYYAHRQFPALFITFLLGNPVLAEG
jgi:hypothetical protein